MIGAKSLAGSKPRDGYMNSFMVWVAFVPISSVYPSASACAAASVPILPPAPGIPVKLFQTPGQAGRRPPRFGEHAREILAEAGFDQDAIDRLFAAEIVAPNDKKTQNQNNQERKQRC